MLTTATLILIALLITILGVLLASGLRGESDLLSTRNFFLAGLIVFQITSAFVAIGTDFRGELAISDPPSTVMAYTFWLCATVTVFLIAYRIGWPAKQLAMLAPHANAAANPTSMLLFAIAMLGIGILCRHVLAYVPVLGVLTTMLGAGLIGAAAGTSAYVVAPRLNRPHLVLVATIIIVIALLAVLKGSFGRRDVLGVLLAVMWGAYFGHWRNRGSMAAALRLGALGAVALVIISAFTAVRHVHNLDEGIGSTVSRLMEADIGEGLVSLADGQQAALNSMWIVENAPESFDYEPLASLVYFVVLPVPRVLWEDKPEGLGLRLVEQARAGRNKAKGFTLGPGLIGHIVADNPYLSLVPYMIGLALFCRFFDEIVRWYSYDPFVVIPVGVGLGHILGIARGEMGLFLFQATVAIIAAWVAMFAVSKTLELFGWRRAGVVDHHWPQRTDADEYDAATYGSESQG